MWVLRPEGVRSPLLSRTKCPHNTPESLAYVSSVTVVQVRPPSRQTLSEGGTGIGTIGSVVVSSRRRLLPLDVLGADTLVGVDRSVVDPGTSVDLPGDPRPPHLCSCQVFGSWTGESVGCGRRLGKERDREISRTYRWTEPEEGVRGNSLSPVLLPVRRVRPLDLRDTRLPGLGDDPSFSSTSFSVRLFSGPSPFPSRDVTPTPDPSSLVQCLRRAFVRSDLPPFLWVQVRVGGDPFRSPGIDGSGLSPVSSPSYLLLSFRPPLPPSRPLDDGSVVRMDSTPEPLPPGPAPGRPAETEHQLRLEPPPPSPR